jgi:ribonuclease Z
MDERRNYFKVVGAWTKAGVSSCIHIKSDSEDVLLDCGVNESSTFSAKTVLISHGHIDHAGCCISHARGKALTSHKATYYVPAAIKDALLQAKAAFEVMDDHEIPMNIVSINPGDSVDISPTVRVMAFLTYHRVPSQGYAVFKKHKGKLLPSFRELTSKEIWQLKKEGVQLYDEPYETLEVVYTGDTTFEALTIPENRFLFSANLFFVELTYLDGERAKAIAWHHIHLDDILDHSHLFEKVGTLVFVHLSQKYSVSRAIETLRNRLPEDLLEKTKVSLYSFGARDVLTSLGEYHPHHQQHGHHHREPGWGWSFPKHKIQRTNDFRR